MLYRADLLSGAIIASVVERAKAMAIKRAIAHAGKDDSLEFPEGITEQDLQASFNAEYVENDIFPPSDITEDWLKLVDYDSDNVVKIAPFRPLNADRTSPIGGVI